MATKTASRKKSPSKCKINPESGRGVLIGGRLYKELIKEHGVDFFNRPVRKRSPKRRTASQKRKSPKRAASAKRSKSAKRSTKRASPKRSKSAKKASPKRSKSAKKASPKKKSKVY